MNREGYKIGERVVRRYMNTLGIQSSISADVVEVGAITIPAKKINDIILTVTYLINVNINSEAIIKQSFLSPDLHLNFHFHFQY